MTRWQVVLWSVLGLGCGQPGSVAVRLALEDPLVASCVVLDILDEGGSLLRDPHLVATDRRELWVGVVQGKGPDVVLLRARAYEGTDGCALPLRLVGRSGEERVGLVRGQRQEVTLTLKPEAVVLPPGATALSLSGPSSLLAGECGTAAVEVRDSSGQPLSVSTLGVALSGSPSSLATFSDSACSVPTSTVNLSNAAGATFYLRGTAMGPSLLTATTPGLPATSLSLTISPASPAKVRFSTGEQSLPAGSCSLGVGVEIVDAFDNPTPLTTDVTLTLAASSNSVTFHSDGSCGNRITDLPVASGSTGSGFYFRGAVGETIQLTVGGPGLISATQSHVIAAPTAGNLVFVTSPLSVASGACSGQVTLQTRGLTGTTPVPVTADTAIALTGPAGVTFFQASDSSCQTTLTNVTLLAGRSNVSFRFRATAAGSAQLTASATGFPAARQTHTVVPGAVAKLVFLTPGATVSIGNCSSQVQVQRRDANDNPVPVAGGAVRLDVVGLGGGIHPHLDSACATLVSQVDMPSGSSVASVYFKAGSSAGTYELEVTHPGSIKVRQLQTVVSGAASSLYFLGAPQMVEAGQCSAALELGVRDSGGNPTGLGAPLAVTLTNPAAGASFYDDSSCTNATTAATIPAGGAGTKTAIYFKGQQVGVMQLGASAQGYLAATLTHNIIAAPASAMVFTNTSQSIISGQCSAVVQLEARDAFGNVAVIAQSPASIALASSPTGLAAYSDSGCGAALASPEIPVGSSVLPFYVKGTTVGLYALSATSPTLGTTSIQHEIVSGPPTGLAVLSAAPSPTVRAGFCSGALLVQSQNAAGLPAQVSSNTTVNLSGPAGVTFYRDALCANAASSVTIASGTDQAQFYFTAVTGGQATLTAQATGLNSGNLTATVLPAVRTGSCVLAVGQASASCTVSPPHVDLARSFMTFGVAVDHNTPGTANVRCALAAVDRIDCGRAGTMAGTYPAAVNIRWYTAELKGARVLRPDTTPCGNNSNCTVSLNASPVLDLTRSFVLFSGTSNGDNQGANDSRMVTLESGPPQRVRVRMDQVPGGNTSHVQVIELAGAGVYRNATVNMNSGTRTVTHNPPGSDFARSALLYSYYSRSNDTAQCVRMVQGGINPGNGSLVFSRGMGTQMACDQSDIDGITLERIEFPAQTVVHQLTVQMTGTESSKAVAVPGAALDLTRTLVVGGGMWASGNATGEGEYAASDNVGPMVATFELTGPNALSATRAMASGVSRWTAYVIQLVP